VEEELFFVDPQTLDAAPAFARVIGEGDERLKPEVFECIVEITTPVVAGEAEVLDELRRLRGDVAERAAGAGLTVAAAGTHAFARGAGQPIVPVPRYRRMVKELGPRMLRQLVCGLHVHVSIPDPETCLRAFEGVVPQLPLLLAASANSPYVEGDETGLYSVRSERLLEMPTGGTPPVLRSWADWERATAGDSTRRHWDAWPRPEYGTLEVRVMDQQTDVRRSAEFAGMIQRLVRDAAEAEHDVYKRELYTRRRAEAARDPAALLGETRARLFEPEAERQLEIGRLHGLAAVVQDVVERSVGSP
jgi:carboxylate-amine ligase